MLYGQRIELVLACLSLAIFLSYHIWHYCLSCLHVKGHIRIGGRRYFNADQFSRCGTMVWIHAFGQQHKDTVAAVQTLRNTLMACTLFATASAYIGARALPTALLDTEYSDALFRLGRVDPFTGGNDGRDALLSPQIKGGISFCLILVSFLCLAQATSVLALSQLLSKGCYAPEATAWARAPCTTVLRYFVHVGFMMKIVSGEYHGEGISYEGEVLAIMAQAQLAFGLGLRGIIAFGISLAYFLGPVSLFVVTVIATCLIIATDHLQVVPYQAVYDEMDGLARQQSRPALDDPRFLEIHQHHEAGIHARHQD